jgi:glycerophosphoryl diester phosphodiesterase
MRIRHTKITVLRNTFDAVWFSYRRAWELRWALLQVHISVGLGVAALASPVVGGFSQIAVRLSGEPALTDMDIARFLVSPIGLTSFVVLAAVVITAGILEIAVMMTVDLADRMKAGSGLWDAGYFILPRLGAIFVFASVLVLRLLAIALPFVFVAAYLAWHNLSEFDINYYLSNRPPLFIGTAVAIAAILILMAVVLINRLVAWSMALPGVLFWEFPPVAVFRRSAEITQSRRWQLLARFSIWAIVAAILGTFILAIAGLVANALLPFAGSNLTRLLVVLLFAFLLWFVANALATALVSASLATLLVGEVLASGVPIDRVFARRSMRPVKKSVLPAVASAAAIAAVAAFATGLLLLDNLRTVDSVEIIAHRGAAGARPENTLASVGKAIEDGADWIEVDVQETADGEVVVIHDSDLMRVGGRNLKIWDAMMNDLAQIDVGSWYSPDYAMERVPTLDSVLSAAKGKAGVVIELKYYAHDDRLEARVAEIVEAAGMADRIKVMSLELPAVRKMKTLRPSWEVGLLLAEGVGDLTRLDVDFLAVSAGLATTGLLRSANKIERKVYAWTVNDPLEMSGLISMGISGLITDEPALAREVLAARAGMSTPQRLILNFASLLGLQLH